MAVQVAGLKTAMRVSAVEGCGGGLPCRSAAGQHSACQSSTEAGCCSSDRLPCDGARPIFGTDER